jgi:hypothetical protein
MVAQPEPGGVHPYPPGNPAGDEVGIEAPSQRLVEVLGPVHISDGHHHNLEFHVHGRGSDPLVSARFHGRVLAARSHP